MYVQIIAKSEDNDRSNGKRSWLNTGSEVPDIALIATEATHLNSPPWHVQLKASDWRLFGSGDRGGETRANNYFLEVELTPADLAAIVNFALKKKLVEVVACKQPSKRK